MFVMSRSSKKPRARGAYPSVAHAQRGMTLLEIMIVLAILGLVIGVLIVPNLLDKLEESKEELTYMEAKKLATETYTEWKIKNRSGCPSLEDLAKIAGKSKLEDQWGQPYTLHCGDNKPPSQRFGVSSKGPDEQEGTEDDIKSWEEK